MERKVALVQALRKSELFSGCDPELVQVQFRVFSKSAYVLSRPDGEPVIGMIVQGKVQVYSVGIDGSTMNLSTLRVGECFGISNIFAGDDLSTILIAETETTIAYITNRCFAALLEQTPGMMVRYATICNQKLQFLTDKIEFLTIHSCRARICAYLLKNMQKGVVTLSAAKEVLSQMLGVSRSSLFRELRYLSDIEAIQMENRKIVITDAEILRHIMENGG